MDCEDCNCEKKGTTIDGLPNIVINFSITYKDQGNYVDNVTMLDSEEE
jgi:hypothetical protein